MTIELASIVEQLGLPGRALARKEALLLPKMEPEELYYCRTGACKMFWKDSNNEEMIFGFCLAGELLVLGEAFFSGLKNEDIYIEALQYTEVYGISKMQMQEMFATYPECAAMINGIQAKMRASWKMQLRILMAHEGLRYGLFCRLFPELVKLNLPEKDLCSFLGVSRSTLSRGKLSSLKNVSKET